jgi:hypothetical protein
MTNPPAANQIAPRFNEMGKSLRGIGLYSPNDLTTTGRTLGYFGGDLGATPVADGTVGPLAASDTSYVVAHRTTGAVTHATTTTNWDDTGTYGRLFEVDCDGSSITALRPWHLLGGGIFDQSSTPGAVDADDVTYTPTTLADWDGSADPGDVEQALDQLAERVTDLEAGGAGDEHYEVDGTPASDDTYGGRAITGVNAGATIAQWEAVYMGSGGEWLLADATDDTAAPCRGLAAAAGTDNNPMTVVTEGVIRNDAWNWTTLGAPIYLSTTTGGLTQTAPSAAGEIVQPVGFAIAADVMYLCIGAATFIEVA